MKTDGRRVGLALRAPMVAQGFAPARPPETLGSDVGIMSFQVGPWMATRVSSKSCRAHPWRIVRDRPLIGGQRDAQHHGVLTKFEAKVRRISILAAEELEDAVFVNSLLDAQELPVLPFAVNQGGGNLAGSFYDMLGRALLLGAGRKEVDGAKVSRHQKLVVTELGNQSAPLRLRIRPGWEGP